MIGFVMSGGSGSRLWPLSREDNPKQFHDLAGAGSMLAGTVRRLASRRNGETPVYVIASERHAGRVQADLAGVDLKGGSAILEPMGRNTAAAVAIAALKTLETFGDELVLVVPSDHVISTDDQFWKSMEIGADAASEGNLVVFGKRPTHPETGYGYIEAVDGEGGIRAVRRFVEKPDEQTARSYMAEGTFFWNMGIFLFSAAAMREEFAIRAPEIWNGARRALNEAATDVTGTYLPGNVYADIPSISIDYAIMEKAEQIAMVPAAFSWNDLGSWQSLLKTSKTDSNGNVITGDVVAIDCENSYLRGQGRLLSAVGLKDLAVVSTVDATFVAPVDQSQNVKKIVEQLEKSGRIETRFTPSDDRMPVTGAWRNRVNHWLFDETLPLWSTIGVDDRNGGFHETLTFDGQPGAKPKRMRTMARQIYAFAVAASRGWKGNADEVIAHGIEFISTKGRTDNGGFVRTFNFDGGVADATEDAYDHACVLLALAYAHQIGNQDALRLGRETFEFIDGHLEDSRMTGFRETAGGEGIKCSNPHMHLLEAFLAWHSVSGEKGHLRRAARIVDLFENHLFDSESWSLGEYFDDDWRPARGEKGNWTEPGHHFEWASLLVDFAARSGRIDLIAYARKLYASAVANGLNRATGLAHAAVSKDGIPLDTMSRSWPQAEAIKAAIALDGTGGPDLKPEIEARVGRLFRWHIDPAPTGLWIDKIDAEGKARAIDAPASIFYHLVCALTRYLDNTDNIKAGQ